jgi:predicted AlkP superfamily phosphohydrolase/phosphomutase
MGFFSRRKDPSSAPARVFVLGLDGVPHSFLIRAFDGGLMPELAALMGLGRLSRMTTVVPTVSSVAWSSYATGKNPGEHGIYGFVDRQAGSYDVFVPTSLDLTGPTLWDVLGAAGRKVIVVNVPGTYPPRPVNGVLVADFLCTNIDKVAYPPELSAWLKEAGYRIDADAKLARTDKAKFFEDVLLTLDRRFETAFRLMDEKPWDFFQLHVMETDRINHFLWPASDADPLRVPFLDFYRRLDAFIGRLARRLPPETHLVMLSDHGFCPIRKEVYLNEHLRQAGLLDIPEGEGLAKLLASSRAYSLIPGRVYVNLAGREPRGSVSLADYDTVRGEVAAALRELRDPDDGTPVVADVIPGEKIYSGGRITGFPAGMPPWSGAVPPDLVAVPTDGYDLKGNVGKGLFGRTELTGMHTWDDAFLFLPGEGTMPAGTPHITDPMPTILSMMGVPPPPDLDGKALSE